MERKYCDPNATTFVIKNEEGLYFNHRREEFTPNKNEASWFGMSEQFWLKDTKLKNCVFEEIPLKFDENKARYYAE